MKLFSEDIDSIRHELELIKDSFGKTNPKRLASCFEILEGFYQIMYELSGEEDEETVDILLKNKKYRDVVSRQRKVLYRKNINNFINDKNMHNSFSGKMINLFDREFKYYYPKRLYLKEDQMGEIICDFLNDEFNQADDFIKLIEEKRIFRVKIINVDEESCIDTAGYTMYDYNNKESIVVLSDDPRIRDVNLMRIIVHEFGHVSDNLDRNNASWKENEKYYWISSYAEVYSMLYEKLFFDYLIKNNIYKENASAGLKVFHMDVYDNFNTIEYLSSLKDELIKNERYRKGNNIVDQIQVDDEGNMYLEGAALDNLNEAKLYSYGGVIANYFSYLKHNDKDKFDRMFSVFKQKRFNLFNFSIFEDIGTNTDEIISIYEKGLDEITDNKKLILK